MRIVWVYKATGTNNTAKHLLHYLPSNEMETKTMSTNAITQNAEVSIYKNGHMYIGVRTTDALDLGYNDQVRVTVETGDGKETFTGFLNNSNQIPLGSYDVHGRLSGDSEGPVRLQAVVEPAAFTWEDFNDLTASRYDGYDTLDSK